MIIWSSFVNRINELKSHEFRNQDTSWLAEFDVDIEDYDWVTWYDPENNLVVKRHYADPWTDQGASELSAYELVE